MLSKIIPFVTRDPVRKIFAIIFAFGLWIYVAIGNNYTYQREIRILYTNLPDSLIIVDSVSSIDVTFSGRGGALFSIWAAPPRAQCDLKETNVGKISISPQELKIPVGYGPLRIDYNMTKITVNIDKKVTKEMKIEVPTKGTLKQDYAIDEISVLDTVRAVGPRKILENMNELSTETLSVKNRNASFDKELRLEIQYPLLKVLPRVVTARINIDKTVEKELTYVPLLLVYSPDQRVRVDREYLDTLVVVGTPRRIKDLAAADIEVRINLTKLGPGEYDLPAEVVLPMYIRPTRSVPRTFNIKIY